jgi:hypothetical protein
MQSRFFCIAGSVFVMAQGMSKRWGYDRWML